MANVRPHSDMRWSLVCHDDHFAQHEVDFVREYVFVREKRSVVRTDKAGVAIEGGSNVIRLHKDLS